MLLTGNKTINHEIYPDHVYPAGDCPTFAHAQDAPLPSWNDGPAKQAILAFVKELTDKSDPKYVAPEERIATFDQDGTLWVEHPMSPSVERLLVHETSAYRNRSD